MVSELQLHFPRVSAVLPGDGQQSCNAVIAQVLHRPDTVIPPQDNSFSVAAGAKPFFSLRFLLLLP